MAEFSISLKNTEHFYSVQTLDVSAFEQPLAEVEFFMQVRRSGNDPGAPLLQFKSTDGTIAVVSEDTELKTITLKFTQIDMRATVRMSGAYVADLVAVIDGARRVVADATITFTQGVTRP